MISTDAKDLKVSLRISHCGQMTAKERREEKRERVKVGGEKKSKRGAAEKTLITALTGHIF